MNDKVLDRMQAAIVDGSRLTAISDGEVYRVSNRGARGMTLQHTLSKDERKQAAKAAKKARRFTARLQEDSMGDGIDLNTVEIIRSPDVRRWPITVSIMRVIETAAGGFTLLFDRTLPDSWKWPSNPQVPSENFQFTVWLLVQVSGVWRAAGFVQMWQGRPMGNGTLPPIFAMNDGVPGYVNWWGDVRKLWGAMSDYVPVAGQQFGIMVTAGNGRLTDGVSSVAERSNVVLLTMNAGDAIDWNASAQPVPQPAPTPQPQPVPVPQPTPQPAPGGPTIADLMAKIDQLEAANAARYVAVLNAILANAAKPAPDYAGTVSIPYLGSGKVSIAPVKK